MQFIKCKSCFKYNKINQDHECVKDIILHKPLPLSHKKCIKCALWFTTDINNLVCLELSCIEVKQIVNEPKPLPIIKQVDNLDHIRTLIRSRNFENPVQIVIKETENIIAEDYVLKPPSQEQEVVLTNVKNNKNCIIMAVAGSGKTTTTLHIARTNPEKKILLLTYNEKLKTETRNKVEALKLINMEVHNFHAFGVKYYGPECQRDIGLNNALKNPKHFNYDIVIVDEAQDLNQTYYDFVMHICTDKTQMIVIGDPKQSIFAFNHSSPKFLKEAYRVFNKNNLHWSTLPLSVTFRLTKQTAKFINDVYLQENIMIGVREGSRPKVILTKDDWDIQEIYDTIKNLLDNKNCTYDDIMLLAPSVKSPKCPIRKLTNKLTHDMRVPIYVALSDDSAPVTNIMQGKLACLTYHQSKGLERKIVFVFGVNKSYFTFMDKHGDSQKCPNAIYVGLTRAIDQLYIIASIESKCPDFADFLVMAQYIDDSVKSIKFASYFGSYIPEKISAKKPISVTRFLNHLPPIEVEKCLKYFEIKKLREKTYQIQITSSIDSNGLKENVSDLNGMAIPAYYEYKIKNKSTIFDQKYNGSVSQLLEISNKHGCFLSGYEHSLNQIKQYDWLSEHDLTRCIEKLKEVGINTNSQFEVNYLTQNKIKEDLFMGAIDCICENTLWEFKCTSRIEDHHYLQLAIYAYLFLEQTEEQITKEFQYKLFNILTGELSEIIIEFDKIKSMIEYIIEYKSRDHVAEAEKKFDSNATKTANNPIQL